MPTADELLDLLGADLNRQILRVTSQAPRSADAVAERCDASLPTVYRHVDDLASAGLLTDETRYDAAGNHYKTYAAALEELSVRLEAGELAAELRQGEQAAAENPVSGDDGSESETTSTERVNGAETEES